MRRVCVGVYSGRNALRPYKVMVYGDAPMRRLYGWLFSVGEGIGVDFSFLFFNDLKEVLAVLVFDHGLSEFAHAVFGDPTSAVGDGFEAGDFEALTLLDDFDESRGFA